MSGLSTENYCQAGSGHISSTSNDFICYLKTAPCASDKPRLPAWHSWTLIPFICHPDKECLFPPVPCFRLSLFISSAVLCILTRYPGASCDEGHYLDMLGDSDSVPLDYFTSGVRLLCVCCAQLLSHIWLFVTPWCVAHHTLSMGFPRQG